MKQKLSVAPTLKNYDKKNLPKDILAGIIIMAVSIPISMGYAQISGLPAVYGLYWLGIPNHIVLLCFPHHRSLYSVWMLLRRRLSEQQCLAWE